MNQPNQPPIPGNATAGASPVAASAPDKAVAAQSIRSTIQPDLLLALQARFALINLTGKIWVIDTGLLTRL